MRLSSHLRRSRHGIYYFRFTLACVDPGGAAHPKKREICVSLRTRDRNAAVILSHEISARALQARTIARAAANWQRGEGVVDIANLRGQLGWISFLQTPKGSVLIKADPHDPVDCAQAQDLVLKLAGVTTAGHAPVGPQGDAPANGARGTPPRLQHSTVVATKSKSLEECRDAMLVTRHAVLDPKTRQEYRFAIDRFIAWAHTQHVSRVEEVKKKHVALYKAYLSKQFGLAPKTINKGLAALGAVFTWAQSAELLPADAKLPTEGQFYKKKELKKASTSWRPFSDKELQAIFSPRIWCAQRTPHEYWVPLLCLHLGLRVGEASQLATDSFAIDDGIWTVSVDEDGGGRDIKTPYSRRVLPLPAALISLGILDYIDDVRDVLGEEGMLFANLPPNDKNGFGAIPSRQFIRHLERHTKRRSDQGTHSLRVSANQKLKDAGIGPDVRCQFLGHLDDSVNSEHYSQPLTVPVLCARVSPVLDFGIDYPALKYKKGQMTEALSREIRRAQRRRRAPSLVARSNDLRRPTRSSAPEVRKGGDHGHD